MAKQAGQSIEAAGFAGQPGVETFAREFRSWPRVADPPPAPGRTMADWRLRLGPVTGTLAEGDRVDLGDRGFTVLHLPGHSPGGIGLLDERDGLFLSGDAIHDDEILDDLPGASIPDYPTTMQRLRRLACRLAIGGHGSEMSRARMVEIAEDYLHRRGG